MLYAHTVESEEGHRWQTLQEHLQNVAERSGDFASVFDAAFLGKLLGLLHDAGKASDAFQRRLRGSSEMVDHSTAGARIATQKYGNPGKTLGFLLAGHHGGLPNGFIPGLRSTLNERLGKELEPYDAYFNLVDLPEKLELPEWMLKGADPARRIYAYQMLLRMLYSCLVDADYLDTESFVARDVASIRASSQLDISNLLQRFKSAMQEKTASANSTDVNKARAKVLQACIEAADSDNGLFTLGVPTGGGKTLSSMSFALHHALRNGQARIIYVIPFTSIVEQTAAVFKNIFGETAVLEHHSNYTFSENDDERALRERLAVQNWDAPIVVTTNVQFFESLYADKPSRCRKIHNIANSVVILDEAQTLPDSLLRPCLAVLEELAADYSTSVVLCTATQPALDGVWPFRSRVKEIVKNRDELIALMGNRTEIEYMGTIEICELVDDLLQYKQVLCVVSSRNAASVLYDELNRRNDENGLYHLSALMVPAHRSKVISEIKHRLTCNERCIVVSTTLIEAGVDADFPVAYREMAGIDSILQAAGRCNREGLQKKGSVYVFSCDAFRFRANTWLGRMRTLGEEIIETQEDPFSVKGVHRFFERRYQVAGDNGLDKNGLLDELCDSQRMIAADYSFEKYGEEFTFIDDEGISVVVPWSDGGLRLLTSLRRGDLQSALASKLQRYTVSIPYYQFQEYMRQGLLEQLGPYYVLAYSDDSSGYYLPDKGLIVLGKEGMPTLIS